jgi:hypothetical protein
MTSLTIEQRPEEDVTVIEGTRYSNFLLRTLGQHGVGDGPFVIVARKDGDVHLRTITRWPEDHPAEDRHDGLRKLRQADEEFGA